MDVFVNNNQDSDNRLFNASIHSSREGINVNYGEVVVDDFDCDDREGSASGAAIKTGDNEEEDEDHQNQNFQSQAPEPGLLEMTQDVIEWDDGSAYDEMNGSGGSFLSPHPHRRRFGRSSSFSSARASSARRPGDVGLCSSKKSIKRGSSRSPSVPHSASSCRSNSSSIFLSTSKRNLVDPIQQRSSDLVGGKIDRSGQNEGTGTATTNTPRRRIDSTATGQRILNSVCESDGDGNKNQTPLEKRKAESEINGILFLLQRDDSLTDDTDTDAVNGIHPSDVKNKLPRSLSTERRFDRDDKRPLIHDCDRNDDSSGANYHTPKVQWYDDGENDEFDRDRVDELQQTQRRNNKRCISLHTNTNTIPISSATNNSADRYNPASAAATSLAFRYRQRQDGADPKRIKSDSSSSDNDKERVGPGSGSQNDCNPSNRTFDWLLQEIMEPSSEDDKQSTTTTFPPRIIRAPLASVDNDNIKVPVSINCSDKSWTSPIPKAADSYQRRCDAQQSTIGTNASIKFTGFVSNVKTHIAAGPLQRRSHSVPLPSPSLHCCAVKYLKRSASQVSISYSHMARDSHAACLDQPMTSNCGTTNVLDFAAERRAEPIMQQSTAQTTKETYLHAANSSGCGSLDNDATSNSQGGNDDITSGNFVEDVSTGGAGVVLPSNVKFLPGATLKEELHSEGGKRVQHPHGYVNDDDDEFVDFLTNIDLEDIDKAVACRTSESSQDQHLAVSKEAEGDKDDEFGDLGDVDFDQIDALVARRDTATPVIPNQIQSSADDQSDEFGTFTDFDLSQIEAQIEQKIKNASSLSLPCAGIVRNLKSNFSQRSTGSGLSCMSYSRYVVLDIVSDHRMCSKTLSVAIWSHAMIKELDRNILHKNCTVRVSTHGPGISSSNETLRPCGADLEYPKVGEVILRGEWFHAGVEIGDIIHICSMTGKFRTDPKALPITLHTMPPPGSDIDDLLLILHPDNLLSPSVISETGTCSRRAVLQSRIGSSGLTSKAALIGTIRHSLFESCMRVNDFTEKFARKVVQEVVVEKAEDLVGCKLSEHDVVKEVLAALPQIQEFADDFVKPPQKVTFGASSVGKPIPGIGCCPDISFSSPKIHSVEEFIISQELGLKGSLDAVLEADVKVINRKNHSLATATNLPIRDEVSHRSLVALELKTGHNQSTQNSHLAQLSLYNLMLQGRYGTRAQLYGNQLSQPPWDEKDHRGCREGAYLEEEYGAAMGGLLLYLNEKNFSMSHLSTQMNEVKTLVSQRNGVASDLQRASRPRGIFLSYNDGSRCSSEQQSPVINLLPAPPADLPELLANANRCTSCFSKRECMVHAASEGIQSDIHSNLLTEFTGHLNAEDLDYFRKWDRLIDLEADASNRVTVLVPLRDSEDSSNAGDDSEVLGGFRFVDELCSNTESFGSDPVLHFEVVHQSKPSGHLHLSSGTNILISIDSLNWNSEDGIGLREHDSNAIFKGSVVDATGNILSVRSNHADLKGIRRLVRRYDASCSDKRIGIDQESGNGILFCVQKNHTLIGTGTLRWNLINFFAREDVPKNIDQMSLRKIQAKEARLSKLRSLIVKMRPPVFTPDPMVVERLFDFNNLGHHDEFFKLKHEFEQLNHGQKSAVYKAFLAQDYALIQGFPGTGKTSVITFLARLLVAHGKRVLITAYTHSAVDNIMMKLMEKGLGVKDRETKLSPLLRIGRQQSCHASIKSIIHTELAANYHQSLSTSTNADGLGPCAAAFRTVIDAARIVGVSALTLPRSSLLREEHFDVVIVDEAGQMNQPATLGVLTAADSFVLVGDHKQLPPLVNSEIAEAGGFGDSMMKCLADCHPSSVVQLTTQYRMNDAICRVASEAFYDNLLQCSGEEQKTTRLALPQLLSNIPGIADEDACWPWLQRIIDPSNPVVFVDTDKVRTTSHHLSLPQQHQHTSTMEPLEVKIGTSSRGSVVNHTEATFVKKIVEGLHGYGGLDLTSVGIISPFRAQIKIMESMPVMERWKYKGMEISTVDSYQGRDKPTIIMSLVRSNLNGNAGRLLQDDRRLNVALTRAKHKLIIVGSFSTLRTGSTPLMPILDSMKQRNEVVVLPQNALEQCAL